MPSFLCQNERANQMRANVGKRGDLTRVAVNLPERLKQSLSESATASNRSLNYEIVVRLQASLQLDLLLDADTAADAMAMLDKLRRRLRDLREEATV